MEGLHGHITHREAPPTRLSLPAFTAVTPVFSGICTSSSGRVTGTLVMSDNRNPVTDLRNDPDSCANLPIDVEVAALLSAVCALISRNTCILREIFCAAFAC